MFIRKHVNRAKKIARIDLRNWQLNQLRNLIKAGLGANWDKKAIVKEIYCAVRKNNEKKRIVFDVLIKVGIVC